jgi:tol-pal system beta propeller repeat protein TolB
MCLTEKSRFGLLLRKVNILSVRWLYNYRGWQCLVWLTLAVLGSSPSAQAVLEIEITEGVEGALPIAIVPFGWQGGGAAPPLDIASVVAGDLKSSGLFAPLPARNLRTHPHEGGEVNFQDWRALGVENLVVGRLRANAPDHYTVEFQLFDVYKGAELKGWGFPVAEKDLRRAAHYVSDIIYEILIGERGAFNTQIAYITSAQSAGEPTYSLWVAGADGHDQQLIQRSPRPLISPAWSPDGRQLAYVSFEADRLAIYVQEVVTDQRRQVAAFPGINSAPAWSPNGKQLALTLSKDGNPDIYILDLAKESTRRITNNPAIDTEPAWSPDGRSLVFTSDRGGRPQIYRLDLSGGEAQRITFEGSYNACPVYSPDGKRLAMVQGDQGAYRIAVLDLKTGLQRVLTDGSLDESPSFSPNGRMILYGSIDGNREVLNTVSIDGRFKQRLVGQEDEVRDPAWSPFLK